MNVKTCLPDVIPSEVGSYALAPFPPKKILFPVDFSDRCTEAGRMVETFTGHFQARLTLLYVLEPLAYNDIPLDPSAESKRRLAGYLAEELDRLEVGRVLLDGDPSMQITEYARKEAFDLIMLPTHGYGRFRRTMLGSVTSNILRDANCPVWTGAHLEQPPKPADISFRKVLCAIDLGKQSCATVYWANQFASELGADLEIIQALSDRNPQLISEADMIPAATAKVEAIQAAVGSKGANFRDRWGRSSRHLRSRAAAQCGSTDHRPKCA
jgi:nucleotide-binding universal stress UspA family protein